VQFGLLGSHSRLHGSSSYRVPWIFEDAYPGEDAKCSAVLRDCVNRKLSLMPYLLRVALEANQRGLPVMRAMLVEFPDDQNVWNVDTQYMLGEGLMVAPVFEREGGVRFYVPRTEGGGVWRSWFEKGKTYEGGRWYEENHGFESLPLLIRPGAVVAVNHELKSFEGDVLDGLELVVNGPLEGDVKVEIVEAKDVGKVSRTVTVTNELDAKGMEGVKVTRWE
jgi:alpha-D-xyloside xylohydrolase